MVASINDLNRDDAEDVAWCVIESLASAHDTAAAVVRVLHLLRDLYGFEEEDGSKVVPNPLFLANGHEGTSPKTKRYLTGRSLKTLGGSALGVGSGLATGITLVDTVGVLQHGSAIGTTVGHMVGIRAAGARFKKSETITRWVDAMIAAKSAKTGVRAAGLVGASIPLPAASLATGIATTIAKLGIKLTVGKLIARTSMEVHWRSYQELILGRGIGGQAAGPCGPASAMFYEVFTKRSFTRIFGMHETEKLIREPGGWIALNDKLMLM